MGRSEWGVLKPHRAQARQIASVVAEHNRLEAEQARMTDQELAALEAGQEVGETLHIECAIRFRGHVFLCMGNGGGAKLTSAFLRARLPDVTILWPFVKPAGWIECQNYVWDAPDNGAQPSGDELAAALPGLPEATPAEGLQGELAPTDPPARDLRDEMFDATQAVLACMMAQGELTGAPVTVLRDVRIGRIGRNG